MEQMMVISTLQTDFKYSLLQGSENFRLLGKGLEFTRI